MSKLAAAPKIRRVHAWALQGCDKASVCGVELESAMALVILTGLVDCARSFQAPVRNGNIGPKNHDRV